MDFFTPHSFAYYEKKKDDKLFKLYVTVMSVTAPFYTLEWIENPIKGLFRKDDKELRPGGNEPELKHIGFDFKVIKSSYPHFGYYYKELPPIEIPDDKKDWFNIFRHLFIHVDVDIELYLNDIGIFGVKHTKKCGICNAMNFT